MEKLTKQLNDDQLNYLISFFKKYVTALGKCEVNYSIFSDGIDIEITAGDNTPEFDKYSGYDFPIRNADDSYFYIEYVLFRDGRLVRYSQRPMEKKEELLETFSSMLEIGDEVPGYIEQEIEEIDTYIDETEEDLEAADEDEDLQKEVAYDDWWSAEEDRYRDEQLWDDDNDEE